MSAQYPMDPLFERQIRVETHVLDIPPNANDLAQQCGKLFQEGRYEEGIALAQRVENYENDATAQRQLGLGLAYMHKYDKARKHFLHGAHLSKDRTHQANCFANIGTT